VVIDLLFVSATLRLEAIRIAGGNIQMTLS